MFEDMFKTHSSSKVNINSDPGNLATSVVDFLKTLGFEITEVRQSDRLVAFINREEGLKFIFIVEDL